MPTAKQSEILFLWDAENANPNGDMLKDNAPRFDEVAGKALVSDVRVKRTIRDDLYERKQQEIFVREESFSDGIVDGIERVKSVAKDSKIPVETIKDICIDVRAFGGVFPIKTQSHNLIGAVQFKMSKSLHQIAEPTFIRGTGAFAAKAGKQQKTFREEYILPYALFGTYGVISEVNAQKTALSEEDVDQILDSLWLGTKNLLTRSKAGQMPRLLLKITYNTPGFFIGELDNKLAVTSVKANETETRNINELSFDFSKIIALTEKYADKIESIAYVADDSIADKITLPVTWKTLEMMG